MLSPELMLFFYYDFCILKLLVNSLTNEKTSKVVALFLFGSTYFFNSSEYVNLFFLLNF